MLDKDEDLASDGGEAMTRRFFRSHSPQRRQYDDVESNWKSSDNTE